MHQARIDDTPSGRLPADDGWFILNVAEIGWETVPGSGTWCSFEAPAARSPLLGIGVHVLHPGETPGFYQVVGTRSPDDQTHYLVEPAAARHGAAVAVATDSAREAYADRPPFTATPAPPPFAQGA